MRHHKHPFVYPGDWVEKGACTKEDPRMFYPPDDKPVPRDFYAKAKAVCNRCAVVAECLKYGETEPYGVWGCTTPVERGRMRDRKIERDRQVVELPLRRRAANK